MADDEKILIALLMIASTHAHRTTLIGRRSVHQHVLLLIVYKLSDRWEMVMELLVCSTLS